MKACGLDPAAGPEQGQGWRGASESRRGPAEAGAFRGLSGGEMEEGRGKTSPSAFRHWLLGRLAAKGAVGALLNLAPESVEILRGAGGAPTVARPEPGGEPVYVSISHTEGAALAAASLRPVGVDLEDRGRKLSDRAWRWSFAEEERRLVEGADVGAYPWRLALWCAKEAAAKSWALPLLNHLSEVRISEVDRQKKIMKVERRGTFQASAQVEIMEAGNFLLALAFRL